MTFSKLNAILPILRCVVITILTVCVPVVAYYFKNLQSEILRNTAMIKEVQKTYVTTHHFYHYNDMQSKSIDANRDNIAKDRSQIGYLQGKVNALSRVVFHD